MNYSKVVEIASDSRHRSISNSDFQILCRGKGAREYRILDSRSRPHLVGEGHKLPLARHYSLCCDIAQAQNQNQKPVWFNSGAPDPSARIEKMVTGESEKEKEQPSEQYALVW